MIWKEIKLSADEKSYIYKEMPLLKGKQFLEALSFHPPGIAAVKDETGAYHIDSNGKPLSTAEMKDAWYPNKPTVTCETNKAPYWENKLNLKLTPIVHKPVKERAKKPSGRPLNILNKLPPSTQNVQIFA